MLILNKFLLKLTIPGDKVDTNFRGLNVPEDDAEHKNCRQANYKLP